MAKLLTAQAVTKMKHSGGRWPREVPDGTVPGLYLVIHPSGRKSWVLRYRRPLNGRTAKLFLGTVSLIGDHETDAIPVIGGHLALAAVRKLAAAQRYQIAIGKDPAAVHKAEQQAVAQAAADTAAAASAADANTFASAAKDFITKYAKTNIKNWQEQAAKRLGFTEDKSNGDLVLIENGLAARWYNRPLAEIDADALHEFIREVRDKGMPGLALKNREPSAARARAVHVTLSRMFRWLLEDERRIKVNPMSDLKRAAKSKPRKRALNDQEIVALWRAADDEGSSPFGAMIKLLILTGCRLREVARMEVKELSNDGATWTIPERRSKNKREHVVPLPPLARAIIADVQRSPECPFVFSTNQRTPVSAFSRLKRRLDRKTLSIQEGYVFHDIRRSVATRMAAKPLSIPPHIIEAVLNHVGPAKAGVAGIYNVEEYIDERTAALEKWADRIVELVGGQ